MRKVAKVRGFSTIELVVVVSIILIVTAMAIPKVMQGIYDIRLRSAASNLSGLMQQARTLAIRNNTYYPIKSVKQGSITLFYVDTSATRTTNTTYDPTFPTVEMGGTVVKTFTNPDTGGTSAPWGFAPLALAAKPYWGPLGLPCVMSSGKCVTTITGGSGNIIAGYQIILTDNRGVGSPGFVCVTASPGGRVKVWRWTNGVWQ